MAATQLADSKVFWQLTRHYTHSLISKENDGLESSIRFKETEASTWRGDDPTKKHKQRGGAQEQGDQQGQAEGRGNGRKEKHAQEHEQE